MKKQTVFTATKVGRTLKAHDRKAFEDYLASLPDGPVTIAVKRKGRRRSTDQNEWIWRALRIMAEDAGYEPHEVEDLHYDLLVHRFGAVEVASRVDGVIRTVPAKTTRHMTTVEFSEYMEWLSRFAAKTYGCVIPLPSEMSDEQYAQWEAA